MCEALKMAAEEGSSFPRWSLNGETCLGIAVSAYDGDTFDAIMCIPSDGGILKRFSVRMVGYNSPEMRQPKGLDEELRRSNYQAAIKARDSLWEYLSGDTKALLRIECGEWEKYGRLLARVFKINDNSEDIDDIEYCVNDKMMALASSKPYML